MTTTIPAGWKPISSAPMDGSRVLIWHQDYCAPITAQWYGSEGWKMDSDVSPFWRQPTHWMPLPTAPGSTPSAPGDAQDERQAFEVWAKRKKMPLARIGQQYDDFWVDHAWNGWQARAAISAPAAGDALDAVRLPAKMPKHESDGADYPSADSYQEGYAEGWNDAIDAALAAQVPQQGEA